MNVSDELKHQLQSIIHELGIQIPPAVSAHVKFYHLVSYSPSSLLGTRAFLFNRPVMGQQHGAFN